MMFPIFSILFVLVCGYGLFKAHANQYVIPHILFDPDNRQWQRHMTVIIYTSIIILMILLYIIAEFFDHLPFTVNAILWILDVGFAIGILDTWSHSVAHSKRYGDKLIRKNKGKPIDIRNLHLN